MGMVRSPKSIAGAVEVALGNAPYKIGDRTVEVLGETYILKFLNYIYKWLFGF
jgi:hypothetical protein